MKSSSKFWNRPKLGLFLLFMAIMMSISLVSPRAEGGNQSEDISGYWIFDSNGYTYTLYIAKEINLFSGSVEGGNRRAGVIYGEMNGRYNITFYRIGDGLDCGFQMYTGTISYNEDKPFYMDGYFWHCGKKYSWNAKRN